MLIIYVTFINLNFKVQISNKLVECRQHKHDLLLFTRKTMTLHAKTTFYHRWLTIQVNFIIDIFILF